MSMFVTIYIFALAPVFLGLFIHLTRKIQDVSISDLLAMSIVSILPILREIITIYVWALSTDKQILFKKYE